MPGEDPLEGLEPTEPKTAVTEPTTPNPTTQQGNFVSTEIFEAAMAKLDKDLGAALGPVIQHIQKQTTAPAGEPTTEEPDALKGLMDDPKAFISDVVKDSMKQMGPYLATQIGDKYDDMLEVHEAKFDSQYGLGAFDKHIRPELETFEKLPVETRSSRQHLNQFIDGIKGRKIDLLTEAATDHAAKAKEDAVKREREGGPAVMLSNGLPSPKPGRTTPEEDTFFDKYAHATGETLDTKGLVKFRDSMPQRRTMTLSDYAAMQPKKEATK